MDVSDLFIYNGFHQQSLTFRDEFDDAVKNLDNMLIAFVKKERLWVYVGAPLGVPTVFFLFI